LLAGAFALSDFRLRTAMSIIDDEPVRGARARTTASASNPNAEEAPHRGASPHASSETTYQPGFCFSAGLVSRSDSGIG
jgi:hypothetical protein